jgi:ComF family protein
MTRVLTPILATLRDLGRGVLDAALPQTCVSCGVWLPGGNGLACAGCHTEIATAFLRPGCPRCGRTLPRASIHEDYCARCRTEQFWNVAGVARVSAYEPAIRPIVLGLKYRGQERNAHYLAEWLAAALQDRGWLDGLDALVPVPMHWLRRWQRPCDHARVLAEALGQRLKIPVVRFVRRARHSPSQIGISSKAQRFENVRGCFAPARWRRPDFIGKTVCIVDNLIATGATIHEVSKVVRQLGARRIYAAVIARAAAPGDPVASLVPADLEVPPTS